MKKILLILRNEFLNTLRRPSFVILGIVIPIAGALIFAGYKAISESRQQPVEEAQPPDVEMVAEGVVDNSGLIEHIPEYLPEELLLLYASEEQAQQAIETGEIQAYYVVPKDYLEKGEVILYYPEDASLIGSTQEWIIRRVLLANLLAQQPGLDEVVWGPVELENKSLSVSGDELEGDCARPGVACESNLFVSYLSLVFVILFYMTFTMSSSLLFHSVAGEKENRTIEVLLSSINSRQMLTGKTIGLGLAGLLQTLCYLISIYIIMNAGGETLNLPAEFQLPPSTILWSVLFYLGGYAVYASMMAGAGALVPRIKEAGSANFIAMLPLLVGYLVGVFAHIAGAVYDLWVVVFSIFPLTAPIVMVLRILEGNVPLWQILLSFGLIIVSAVWIMRAVARVFDVQNLLSGQPFSAGRYLRTLLGVKI